MSEPIVNAAVLEPLFQPWEYPSHHRIRARKENEPAQIMKGRRPSPIVIAQNLRQAVSEWRKADYAGASDTTMELFGHWFFRNHLVKDKQGNQAPFRYYFCQQEAIETYVYLMEIRKINTIAGLFAEFGGADRETAALGINPEEDLWPRYGFKVATGAGKTKIMSLAIVWSYFHELRESDSPMTRHFVVIAPNLTVFERLKEDFGPEHHIFDHDPLIPIAWKGDWNLSVIFQDQASGATTGGTLYLTNIHRLYDKNKRKLKNDAETYSWCGPAVSKARALDTGEALRERVTSHPKIMVLNDEAHHVWKPDLAWHEAIEYLNETIRKRTGGGIVAQLDFSATPKDNKGNMFKHIICDAPLGEAVDAGIVKTPIIGRGQKLVERTDTNAAYRYENHLTLGYKRWLASKEEWQKSGKKALMFVMTEDTDAANQIAQRLNCDPLYSELNGKTINLHTRLKGKLKKKGKGQDAYYEFVENENEISDDDLKELRKLSRELDNNTSPFQCIVSVLMLREGWDVRNVTTIIPLRPYSSKANILPEQTLGRGLRRMTPCGQAAEVVTVVEHSAFVSLYKQELSREGLPIEVVDVEQVPRTTVTIFPDEANKDLKALDILIPKLTAGHRIIPQLDALTFDEIKEIFKKFKPLPLGEAIEKEIDYEGRHLFTNEIVEQMKVKLPLLENGIGAISFYREELEHLTGLRGAHPVLAPLIQKFLEELLFEERVDLFDPRLVSRLADTDVREYIRAAFVPLIRKKITFIESRVKQEEAQSVCWWKPFQVTHSERRPTVTAQKTPFNLVPCNRELELALTHFLDNAPDVAAFAKNAGPQSLRVDYLASGHRLAFYTPDFLVRNRDGSYFLVETKGREDRDVPLKVKAAIEWCKSASKQKIKWEYLYVPQGIFSRFSGNAIEDLARTCAPSVSDLLSETVSPQLDIFAEHVEGEEVKVDEFIDQTIYETLPSRYKKSIEQAILLFDFHRNKQIESLSPIFQPLLGPLDDAAKAFIISKLSPDLPETELAQKDFFNPYYGSLSNRDIEWHRKHTNNLRRTLVYHNGLWPLGLLKFCLDYSENDQHNIGGVFESIKKHFKKYNGSGLLDSVNSVADFRNKFVAHQEEPLTDVILTKNGLKAWIRGLVKIYQLRQA